MLKNIITFIICQSKPRMRSSFPCEMSIGLIFITRQPIDSALLRANSIFSNCWYIIISPPLFKDRSSMVFGAEKFIALQISSPSLHLVNNSLVSGFIGLDARFKSWSSAKFLDYL